MTTPARVVVGTYRYETTDPLFTGEVTAPGIDLDMRTGRTLPEIFSRLLVDDEFDVAELGMTFLQRVLAEGRDDFVALPVFPNRVFRHSCVFVNVDSGIHEASDLAGRTIGEFGIYGQDSGVWAKGIFRDEYGYDPATSSWVVGGLDAPAPPFDFVPQTRPEGVEIRDAGAGQALGPMLEIGAIDALFTANVPQLALDGSPRIRRLFVDAEDRERDWFARTGIFPMMHTIVVRRRLVEQSPELVHAIYDAFVAAKGASAERIRRMRRLFQVQSMLPWADGLAERDRDLMGDDWWPYGIAANRRALETNLRYQHEQGIVDRTWGLDELFAADYLGS